MAGIFTYMTGNWELLGNGQKDRKISPRGRKWNGRLTGNWALVDKKMPHITGNGRNDRKISPRGRKWKGKG